MDSSENAQRNHDALFPNHNSTLARARARAGDDERLGAHPVPGGRWHRPLLRA